MKELKEVPVLLPPDLPFDPAFKDRTTTLRMAQAILLPISAPPYRHC
jgi:hypothetical protein